MSRTHFSFVLTALRALGCFVLLGCALQLYAASAPTQTKLYIVPDGPVYAGKVVNFKAWVSESGAPVKQGVVYFCDAAAPHCSDSHILAQVQLRSSGTAEVNLIPPRGTHEVQAVFQGTKIAAASKSAIESLVVTGPQFVSATTISQSGTPGDYTLTGTVTSIGAPLSGYMDFLNAGNGNSLVDEEVLGPSALTFVSPPPNSTVTSTALATADFDGDGRPDQVTSVYIPESNSNAVSISLGNGDGTFTLKSTLPEAFYLEPTATVGDFNGDDIPDLVVIDRDNSSISVYPGKGDGTFLPAVPVPITSGGPFVVSVGDVNNDGIPDLIIAAFRSGLQTFLGNGDGTFVAGPMNPATPFDPFQIATGDFNRDGKLDVIVASGYDNTPLVLLLGNGDGSFTPAVSPTLTNLNCLHGCGSVVAADFNQDGNTDLAILAEQGAQGNGLIHILLGNGNGKFTMGNDIGGYEFYNLGTADFNGDGVPDLIAFYYGFPAFVAVVYTGDGAANFAPQTTRILSISEDFFLADLNNDGKSDMIVSTEYYTTDTVSELSEFQATATATGVALPAGEEVYAKYEGNKTHRPSESTSVNLPPSSSLRSRPAIHEQVR